MSLRRSVGYTHDAACPVCKSRPGTLWILLDGREVCRTCYDALEPTTTTVPLAQGNNISALDGERGTTRRELRCQLDTLALWVGNKNALVDGWNLLSLDQKAREAEKFAEVHSWLCEKIREQTIVVLHVVK